MIDSIIDGNMICKAFGYAKLLIIVLTAIFKTWLKNAVKEEGY